MLKCYQLQFCRICVLPAYVQLTTLPQSVCLPVSLYVCLSTHISQKPHVQNSQNSLYTLPVVMAESSSNNNAVSYVLPVLWMTSCFHIMGHMQITSHNSTGVWLWRWTMRNNIIHYVTLPFNSAFPSVLQFTLVEVLSLYCCYFAFRHQWEILLLNSGKSIDIEWPHGY